MNIFDNDITGFVLAGGKSSRMGYDKGLINIGESTLIQSAVHLMKGFTKNVFILAPTEKYKNIDVPCIPDKIDSRGPLSALYTGLISSRTQINIFLACDMPKMRLEFIRYLAKQSNQHDAVLMKFDDGKIEPLCGIYKKSCLTIIKSNFEHNQYKLSELLDKLNVAYISEKDLNYIGLDCSIFTNINTPEDLKSLS